MKERFGTLKKGVCGNLFFISVFNYLLMIRYSIIYQEQSYVLEILRWIQNQIWSNGKVIFIYFIYLYK